MLAVHHEQITFDFEAQSSAEPAKQRDDAPKRRLFGIESTHNEPAQNETENWSDEDIIRFVEHFLYASLSTLASGFAGKASHEEVTQWLTDDDTDSPLSFSNCCSMLGLDKDSLRSRALISAKKTAKRYA